MIGKMDGKVNDRKILKKQIRRCPPTNSICKCPTNIFFKNHHNERYMGISKMSCIHVFTYKKSNIIFGCLIGAMLEIRHNNNPIFPQIEI